MLIQMLHTDVSAPPHVRTREAGDLVVDVTAVFFNLQIASQRQRTAEISLRRVVCC